MRSLYEQGTLFIAPHRSDCRLCRVRCREHRCALCKLHEEVNFLSLIEIYASTCASGILSGKARVRYRMPRKNVCTIQIQRICWIVDINCEFIKLMITICSLIVCTSCTSPYFYGILGSLSARERSEGDYRSVEYVAQLKKGFYAIIRVQACRNCCACFRCVAVLPKGARHLCHASILSLWGVNMFWHNNQAEAYYAYYQHATFAARVVNGSGNMCCFIWPQFRQANIRFSRDFLLNLSIKR